jgi:hypothetical protein
MIISNPYLKKTTIIFLLTILYSFASAQGVAKKINRIIADSSSKKMNMDAIYNRPFLTVNKMPIAIGGYIEANTTYTSTNGVSEGFDFQMRRLTLFFSSTITQKIKFLSELEFENGTQEINIESAVMDVEFMPLLVFRGGIILNPIGAYNQNHDGPRWDFIDRPIAMTEIIPSTLSNVGFGLYGRQYLNNWTLGYECYATNGFDDKLILNELNHSSFHEAKENASKFEKSNSGLPMLTSKIAIKNRNIGELGLSYLTSVYNKWNKDGLKIDEKRSASLMAIDFNSSIWKNRITITGEVVKALIDLPTNYVETYGSKQFGGYCDVIGTVYKHKMFGWSNAKLNVGLRFDYADYNQNKFKTTGDKIYDEVVGITPSLSFRPTGTTVMRFNYKRLLTQDIVGNDPSKTGTIQFGISTYF